MGFFALLKPISIDPKLEWDYSSDVLPFLHTKVPDETQLISFTNDAGLYLQTNLLDLAELRASVHKIIDNPELVAQLLYALPKHPLDDKLLMDYFFNLLPLIKTSKFNTNFETLITQFCQSREIKISDLPIQRLLLLLMRKRETKALEWLHQTHPDFEQCFYRKEEHKKPLIQYITEDDKQIEYIFDFIKRRKLEHLFLTLNKEGKNFLQVIIELENFSALKKFFEHGFGTELFTLDVLHSLRVAYFHAVFSTDKKDRLDVLDKMCDTVRSKLAEQNIVKKTPKLSDPQQPEEFSRSCQTLFGFKKLPSSCKPREALLINALTTLLVTLSNPAQCFSILKFLNSEFVRYCAISKTPPFTLDKSSYKFIEIDGIFYPCPNSNYVSPFKKNSILQKFLIAFLRNHGLAKTCVQWVGYVPSEHANQNVINGDFITENRLGTGLFHNKLAHMLQYAMLICMVEQGLIKLENGGIRITIQEIIGTLVTMKVHGDDHTLWQVIFDQPFIDAVSFTDPYRLTSVIMHDADELKTREIADVMIDSLCKGADHLQVAFNAKGLFTTEQFLGKFSDQHLNFFLNIPSLCDKACKKNFAAKLKLLQKFYGENAAIFEKKYDINPAYVPTKCSPRI